MSMLNLKNEQVRVKSGGKGNFQAEKMESFSTKGEENIRSLGKSSSLD